MKTTREHRPAVTPRRRSLLQRALDALRGRRSPQVLVVVSTTSGPRAVAVPLDDLR